MEPQAAKGDEPVHDIYERLNDLDRQVAEVRAAQTEHHTSTIGALRRLEKAVIDGNGTPALLVRVDRLEQRQQARQAPWWVTAIVTALCSGVMAMAVVRAESCERRHVASTTPARDLGGEVRR